MRQKVRTIILDIFLIIYNLSAALLLNILMWKNHMWSEKKWTKLD